MALTDFIKVPQISKILTTMINPSFAKKALIPALSGGAVAGVGAYQLLAGTNLTQGRTLLTGYIASGVALSVEGVLPDMGSFDEAGSVLLGGTAAGFIVNAAFGKLADADTDGDGSLTDAEKLASYNVQFAPIGETQRMYASVVTGLGVALAAYAEMARGYNNV